MTNPYNVVHLHKRRIGGPAITREVYAVAHQLGGIVATRRHRADAERLAAALNANAPDAHTANEEAQHD